MQTCVQEIRSTRNQELQGNTGSFNLLENPKNYRKGTENSVLRFENSLLMKNVTDT